MRTLVHHHPRQVSADTVPAAAVERPTHGPARLVTADRCGTDRRVDEGRPGLGMSKVLLHPGRA